MTNQQREKITEQEYAEIDTILLQKYRPYLGMLFSENA